MKKTILLSLGVLVLGVLVLDRVKGGKCGAGFPGDFRDAPGSDSALKQLAPSVKSVGVIAVPAPSLVPGSDRRGARSAASEFPAIFLQLNSRAFRGDTGEDTERNVTDFVGQLGKKMVAYNDLSLIGTVKVVSEGRRGMFATLANQLRIESSLKTLPEMARFHYESLSVGQTWDIGFKKSMYRDRIDKILAPLVARHGLKVQYPNSIETLDSGLLDVQIPADSADPSAYAKQLCLRFPDKLKFVDRVCCACEKK